jgi:glycosyltransferase involved in cell wall biosynthesis
MRVIHVVPSGHPTHIQGDQTHAFCLAGTQRAQGMDAAMITNREGLFYSTCEQDGIPVFAVSDLSPSAEANPPIDILVGKIKEFNPDIIHCHNITVAKAVVAAATKLQIPCVISLHAGLGFSSIRELIAAKRSGQEFTLIAVCKKEFDGMQRSDLAGIDFHYVPYGTNVHSSTDRQQRNGSGLPNLMLVGTLDHRKGIDLAILAMFELQRRRGAGCPVLNIYGDGPEGKYLTEVTKTLHLDDVVKFQGLQVGILDKCPRSDILVVPSRKETGPIVVLEAMSRGIPIVASDVGEVRQMLPDQQYGRIVPVESITELADAIDSTLTDIASGQFNPDLLIERHQSQFSTEKMADRVEAVYQSTLLAYRSAAPA